LVELFISVAVIAVLVAILLPAITSRLRRYGPLISCINNLKQVGLAFRTWTLDHNDKLPISVSVTNGGIMELPSTELVYLHFQVLSNELSTPKILVCPA